MANTDVDEVAPLIFRPARAVNAVDNRTQFQRQCAVCLILASAGFERLAFYSLIGNLVIFLKSDHIRWTSINSVTSSLIFLGISYVSAIFFAWLSDGKVGRAKTVIIGFILYAIGYVFIPLFADNDRYHIYRTLCGQIKNQTSSMRPLYDEQCSGLILSTLILIAIGVGAVQANMAVFGAEQIQEQRATTQYFDKYYAAVNTGGLIAFGLIAYIQQNGHYFYGYIIPAGFLIVAVILFVIGYPFYAHTKPYDSVISTFIPVLINAIQNWWQQRQNNNLTTINHQTTNTPTLLSEHSQNHDQRSFSISGHSASFLDYAKLSNNGKFLDRIVDDIKSIRSIIVVFLLLIPYWLLYFQIETTFLVQGLHMAVPALSKNQHMPVIWLSLGDQVIIIISIFVLNTFVYKRLHASGRSISIQTRITVGMICASLAMCAAGTVEIFRQNKCDYSTRQQDIGNATYTAADLSIFTQFPQYVGVGLSEVFASVASLEFAYLAAPRSAQSLIMSLRFCSAGLSSFFGSAYINLFVTIDPNFDFSNQQCKPSKQPEMFYIYFFILAGLQLVFLLIFLSCNRKFNILKISQHRFNTRLFVTPDYSTSTA